MKKLITVSIIVLFSHGCATPYQVQGLAGGYSETQLDVNVFKVSFGGNGYTNRERSTDFALLRSAELTLQNGFQYFAIIETNTYTLNSTYTTPSTSHTTGSAYGVGNYVYGNATTTTTGGQTFNISKPTSSNTIILFNEKPDSTLSYNAKYVYNSIRKKYDIE